MSAKIPVTDAELPIMKALWDKGCVPSPELFEGLPGNKSTLKTLLLRLVQKGAVGTEGINRRTYRYRALVTRDDYIAEQRQSLLRRAFDGSAEKMLLNFVQGENIPAEALRRLVDLIEEGEP